MRNGRGKAVRGGVVVMCGEGYGEGTVDDHMTVV